jgi:hypothetical protein
MSEKLEHLKLVQGVVQRLSQNSFAIKGWCITIVSALIALGAKDSNPRVVIVAIVPCVVFGFLDAFYLWRERQFRELYARIARGNDVPTFSMNASDEQHVRFCRSLCSAPVAFFYLCLLGISILAIALLSPLTGASSPTTLP